MGARRGGCTRLGGVLALLLGAALFQTAHATFQVEEKDDTAVVRPLPYWHPHSAAEQEGAAPGGQLPDKTGTWETCDQCEQCILGPPPVGSVMPPPPEPSGPHGHRVCKQCYGCNVVLDRLQKNENMLGKRRIVFSGASGAAVMRGRTLNGPVIVKIWCGLKGGYKQTSTANELPEMCPPPHAPCKEKGGLVGQSECNFRFLNSLQRMTDDANLTAISPRTWTANVRSFLPWDGEPSAGWKVDTRAQMYEVAMGVSIEAFLGGFLTEEGLAMIMRIPAEQVRLAAAFDFMFGESDRHGQNVMFHESGKLTLIDNENFHSSHVNSMFLPGTQKYEIYRVGYNAVCCANLPGLFEVNCPGAIGPSAPEALLDYRCFTPGEAFGRELPPGMMEWVQEMAKLSARDILDKYDLIRLEHAERLKKRIDEVFELGFEEALITQLNRQPRGNGMTYGNNWSYRIPKACCHIPQCPFRLERTYEGPMKHPQYSSRLPYVEPGYNCKIPPGSAPVGEPVDAHPKFIPPVGPGGRQWRH